MTVDLGRLLIAATQQPPPSGFVRPTSSVMDVSKYGKDEAWAFLLLGFEEP